MFQSPHRRGGSRDEAEIADLILREGAGFNPLIGGADRATLTTILILKK